MSNCRTTRRQSLLSLSLLDWLTPCRYQQESLYKQPLVRHDYMCDGPMFDFVIGLHHLVEITFALLSFVSPRSTLQGQCTCCGHPGPSRSATCTSPPPESTSLSVSYTPSKYSSSSGGWALPSSSSLCLTSAPAKHCFTPGSREQHPPAATCSCCHWQLTASRGPLCITRGHIGRKWAAWTCKPEYECLTQQSGVRFPAQRRGGFDRDGAVKDQRHRWHPAESDRGGEREGRKGEETIVCKGLRLICGFLKQITEMGKGQVLQGRCV